MLEAMGFNVVIMPLPEVYLAIQQGAVSGQENPIDTIHANKFYEVAPNVTLTQHVYSPIPLTISEKTWQKLSPPTARRCTQGGEGSRGLEPQGESAATTTASSKDMAAKGAKVAPARPRRRSARRCKPVYAKAKEKYGADVDAILADADAVRKATAGEVSDAAMARCRTTRRGTAPATGATRSAGDGRCCPPGRRRRRRSAGSARPSTGAIVAIGATMATLVFCNVISTLFGGDIAWTTEFCELLMVWVTFLGGAAATRRGAHMAITEFLDKLAGPARRRRRRRDPAARAGHARRSWSGTASASPTPARSSELTVLRHGRWPRSTLALPVGCGDRWRCSSAWDLVADPRAAARATQRYGAGDRMILFETFVSCFFVARACSACRWCTALLTVDGRR